MKKTAAQIESTAEAASGLDAFVAFCDTLLVEDGSPLELYPEQKLMLSDYFAGARETLILIPKKNGKSTLLGALALFHLLTTPDAACFIGASSRDQATILYRQAGMLVERSGLQDKARVQKGYRHITSTVDSGAIRVLSADENTADGVIPTLALVDELHRHKSSGLYGVFRDGLGPRNGRMVTISTAGDDEESPLGRLRRRAHSLPGFRSDGAYHHVSTPEFALHEWALAEGDDRDDLSVVAQANPAPWQSEAELAIRRDSPSMTPWQWARFACGIWEFGEQGAFSAKEWRACEDPNVSIPDGATGVVIGVDLGWAWDTSAFVPIWKDAEGRFVIDHETIVTPPRDGTRTPYSTIWGVVEDMAERFAHPTFVVDPEAGGAQLADQIEGDLDAELVLHSQKAQPMALAAQRLSEAISSGTLRHAGRSELTIHVLAASPRPVGEAWRLGKPKRSNACIDAAVALAMAVSVASVVEKPLEFSFAFA